MLIKVKVIKAWILISKNVKSKDEVNKILQMFPKYIDWENYLIFIQAVKSFWVWYIMWTWHSRCTLAYQDKFTSPSQPGETEVLTSRSQLWAVCIVYLFLYEQYHGNKYILIEHTDQNGFSRALGKRKELVEKIKA